MTPAPEASAPINRDFLRKYAQQIVFSEKHEEYIYCGQRYSVSWDKDWPLDEGWKVYKIYRVD